MVGIGFRVSGALGHLIPRLGFIHSAGSCTFPAKIGRRHRGRVMSNTVLTVLDDVELREVVERVAAAVGIRVVASPAALTRKTWSTVSAVVLDEPGARRCEGMPRRAGLILVCCGEPDESTWQAAITVGAQHLCALPAQEGLLTRNLADAAEEARGGVGDGRVIAVVGGCGGAGASVFAAALAQTANSSLLVDLDPWSGGIDLLLASESVPGLRWPDLSLQGGRLSWPAVRDALPNHRGISVLSGARSCHEMDAGPVEAILDAGRRGGVMVICDLPRRATAAAGAALESADLVVAITTCDVRGVASTSAMTPVLRAHNPNVGLVVRGPSPGGLRAREVADVAQLPLLAAMRPEPMLSERRERGGLRLGRRSPLSAAARDVLGVLHRGVLAA
jgi:secretion/DNA translocation related CpaE-like protein